MRTNFLLQDTMKTCRRTRGYVEDLTRSSARETTSPSFPLIAVVAPVREFFSIWLPRDVSKWLIVLSDSELMWLTVLTGRDCTL